MLYSYIIINALQCITQLFATIYISDSRESHEKYGLKLYLILLAEESREPAKPWDPRALQGLVYKLTSGGEGENRTLLTDVLGEVLGEEYIDNRDCLYLYLECHGVTFVGLRSWPITTL